MKSSLFEFNEPGLDAAYVHLREPDRRDVADREAIDQMWERYRPYADNAFASGFARDVDGRFWEMYLGYVFLDAGLRLLPTLDRPRRGGQPDLCVLNGDRRIWIEAISVSEGATGPDQVTYPVPVNQGGGAVLAPTRQAQLRITSAFQTKFEVMKRYLAQGVVHPEDVRALAINVSRFAMVVREQPWPLIVNCLFPIGNEYVTLNRVTNEVTSSGYRHASTIARANGDIAANAFIDPAYSAISGVVYSRVGIGQRDRTVRPLTLVHNPLAEVPLEHRWGPWDREIVAELASDGDGWEVDDIRASRTS